VAMPGLCGDFESLGFEFLCGISGDGPEAPDLIASVGVVGDERAADAVIGAVVANEDAAFGDVWSASDSGLRRIANGGFPNFFSGGLIDGDGAAIARADVNFSVPDGDATVGAGGVGAIDGHAETDARVEFPEEFSSRCVDSINFGLGSADV